MRRLFAFIVGGAVIGAALVGVDWVLREFPILMFKHPDGDTMGPLARAATWLGARLGLAPWQTLITLGAVGGLALGLFTKGGDD